MGHALCRGRRIAAVRPAREPANAVDGPASRRKFVFGIMFLGASRWPPQIVIRYAAEQPKQPATVGDLVPERCNRLGVRRCWVQHLHTHADLCVRRTLQSCGRSDLSGGTAPSLSPTFVVYWRVWCGAAGSGVDRIQLPRAAGGVRRARRYPCGHREVRSFRSAWCLRLRIRRVDVRCRHRARRRIAGQAISDRLDGTHSRRARASTA